MTLHRELPLSGITVVSIEQAVAAPFATRQLADLGARVIKIERPEGDFARNYDTTVHGESSFFVWLNRGKESICLDLKTTEDSNLLSNLLAQADVFVHNLSAGAVERLGFNSEKIRGINPSLIEVTISGYGSTGPYSEAKAYDLLIQAESGLVSITGNKEGAAKVSISIADIAAGMYAYSAVLSAVIFRNKTGKGDTIEISMLEALSEWMSQPYLYTRYGGSPPVRGGVKHATIAPYGPYETSSGAVVVAIQNQREWQRFCEEVLGNKNIFRDPRFVDNQSRVKHTEELDAIIHQRFSKLTLQQVVKLLKDADIPQGELRDISELSQHPQLIYRQRFIEVPGMSNQVEVPLPPIVSQRYRPSIGKVPALGEHTQKVREEFN